MSSLKQTIINAVLKVTSDPKYEGKQYETPEAARDDFAKALIAELFPESPEMPTQTKTESVEMPVLEEAMANMTLEEPKKEKKKPGPKPKSKPEGSSNIEKLNPTQTKKLKIASEELKVDMDKKGFLAYLNGLTSEEFDDKKFEDHIKDFLNPPKPEPEKPKNAELELVSVEFEDEEYWVDPKTKKVYKTEGNVDVHVGDIGLAKFADMEIPEE